MCKVDAKGPCPPLHAPKVVNGPMKSLQMGDLWWEGRGDGGNAPDVGGLGSIQAKNEKRYPVPFSSLAVCWPSGGRPLRLLYRNLRAAAVSTPTRCPPLLSRRWWRAERTRG